MIPVLMYHSVSEHPPRTTRRLSVSPTAFADQLDLLDALGFRTLTFSEMTAALRTGSPFPDRAVVLTFDDGYADFYENALPLLAGHGFTATLFVTTGWLSDAGEQAAGTPLDRMLSWRHLTELGDAGVEIGGHSTSHPQLDQLPPAALQRELRDSKDLLEQRLGRPVHSLAYPFGYSSRRVRAAVAAAGYRSAAAVANGCAGPRPDLLALPRLTIARSTQLGTFARIVHGAELRRIYFAQHALTHGYAAVRWCRSLLHRVRPGA